MATCLDNSPTLDRDRSLGAGSFDALAEAIHRGACPRISPAFRHKGHIDLFSASAELIQEFAEFRVTYLLDQHWSAKIMTLRQPVDRPYGMGHSHRCRSFCTTWTDNKKSRGHT